MTSSADAGAGTCGCAGGAKATAWFAASGDEKMTIDPTDARVSLDATYTRGAFGKKQVVLAGVVRVFRSDVPSERPTTLSIRAVLPEGTSGPAIELDAYVTTWASSSAVAPRAYATIAKSALTYTVTDGLLEIRGSLTLKDVAAGRTVVLDKLSLRKSGSGLLPERTGAFRAP